MNGESHVTPLSPGDLEIMARALGWPAVCLDDGRLVAGEDAWRAAIESADADECEQLREALPDQAEEEAERQEEPEQLDQDDESSEG